MATESLQGSGIALTPASDTRRGSRKRDFPTQTTPLLPMGTPHATQWWAKRILALGELRALAGLLEAVLLALDRTGISREQASLLELGAILACLEQGAGDAKT